MDNIGNPTKDSDRNTIRKRNQKTKGFDRLLLFSILIFCIIMTSGCSNATKSYGTQEDVSEQQKQPEEGLSMQQSEEAGRFFIKNNENWMLMLVNEQNPLPDNYVPELKTLKNGLQFDARAIDQLNAMINSARKQGLSPVICSAYRTVEYQRTLFNNQVYKQMSKGLSREKAEIEALTFVAYPGKSEHNLGLAVDIVSTKYQQLDEKQAKTPEIKWITEHCSEYGFILRYPKDKQDITGFTYEPWHFRYVGVQAAKEIMENGICLEEYLEN